MRSSLKRTISFAAATVLALFLTFRILHHLSGLKSTVQPEVYLVRTAIALAGYFFAILAGWIAIPFAGGAIFAFLAAVMVFFVMSVSSSSVFVWFLLEYAGLCYLLYRMERYYEDQIAGVQVDREKYQNERNDLEVAHKLKGEGISILFEKYSTYYNLRKLAEELGTSLSVSQLGEIIVKRCFDFVNRGDITLLSLADSEAQHFSVAASKQSPRFQSNPLSIRQGDLFDFWVVKNQRRLIVSNAQQDFRFDVKEAARFEDLKSLIIAPLVYERRVIGTLRVNSGKPETFSNDDLRLLDTIAVLASSAISNALLFEQTEELAIRDSLTGLYMRRYFFDRLKDEHRRALLTQRPLSLLMFDLDHFKESNDRYGHAAGDLMLIHFSRILEKSVENAIVARYGGEEFIVLLPETSREAAAETAEKIRKAVEQSPFIVRREKIPMSVSIGVSNLPADTLDHEMLLQKADQALYQAKRSGRNRVCLSES